MNDEGEFLNFFTVNLTLCSIFSFEIVLTVRNKLNDLRVLRDSLVNFKFIFLTVVVTASPPLFLKLPNFYVKGTLPVDHYLFFII